MSVGGGAVFMVKEDLGNPVKSACQFSDPPSQGFLGLTRGTGNSPGLSRGKRSLFCWRGPALFSLAPETPDRARGKRKQTFVADGTAWYKELERLLCGVDLEGARK